MNTITRDLGGLPCIALLYFPVRRDGLQDRDLASRNVRAVSDFWVFS